MIDTRWFVVKLSYDGVNVSSLGVHPFLSVISRYEYYLYLQKFKKKFIASEFRYIYFCILRNLTIWEYDVEDQGVA